MTKYNDDFPLWLQYQCVAVLWMIFSKVTEVNSAERLIAVITGFVFMTISGWYFADTFRRKKDVR